MGRFSSDVNATTWPSPVPGASLLGIHIPYRAQVLMPYALLRYLVLGTSTSCTGSNSLFRPVLSSPAHGHGPGSLAVALLKSESKYFSFYEVTSN